jgi:hypothetical protein
LNRAACDDDAPLATKDFSFIISKAKAAFQQVPPCFDVFAAQNKRASLLTTLEDLAARRTKQNKKA